jgi:hypothetical protein
MDLETQLLFNTLANFHCNVLIKLLIDFSFVVVNSNKRRFMMLYVDHHFERVTHSHSQIVELIQVLLILKYILEIDGVEVSLPVQESASCGLVHVPLPVGNNINLPSTVFETFLCLGFHDVLVNQAFAMIDHRFPE